MTRKFSTQRSILLAALVSVATAAWAACREDCAVDLKAALDACEVNDANDPKNLSDCRDEAQRDYQACLEDCGG